MSETLIQFREVAFTYEDARPVLNGVTFGLSRSERVALVGPNGSGKSTLLHLAVGLLQPDDGEIEAFGKVRTDEKDFHEVRARTGLLFQEPEDQLFCPTVLEDVAFGPLNLGRSPEEAHAIAEDTLSSLGLQGYGKRITHKLSEGEKRLVSLASVLAMKPEVLLLDEPTAGLDTDIIEHIVDILGELSLTIFAVSHNDKFLDRITDRALRLKDGLLQESAIESQETESVGR